MVRRATQNCSMIATRLFFTQTGTPAGCVTCKLGCLPTFSLRPCRDVALPAAG